MTEKSVAALMSDALIQILIVCVPFCIWICCDGADQCDPGWVESDRKPLQPKFDKFNPINGFKRIFQKILFLNWSNLFLKFCYRLCGIYLDQRSCTGHFILYEIPLMQAIMLCGTVIINAGLKISLVYLVIGLADFIYQKYRFNEDMKMTKQEVKDEFKIQRVIRKSKADRDSVCVRLQKTYDAGCSKSGRCHHEPDSLCSCDQSMMLRHQRHRLFLQREKIIWHRKSKGCQRTSY